MRLIFKDKGEFNAIEISVLNWNNCIVTCQYEVPANGVFTKEVSRPVLLRINCDDEIIAERIFTTLSVKGYCNVEELKDYILTIEKFNVDTGHSSFLYSRNP